MAEQLFYSFIGLELVQFSVYNNNCEGDAEPLELSNAFLFAYNFDDEVVCCTTIIEITKEGRPVLRAELKSYFKIQSESVKAMTEGNCVTLPTNLMAQCASLGYGTMRGVIFVKTMGTSLEKLILPPSDILNAFDEPVKFKR